MFVDLHTHLIPCVDDGSPDLATSIGWLSRMAASGVDEIAVTPHVNLFFDPSAGDSHASMLRSRGWGLGGADPRTFVAAGFDSLQRAAAVAGVDVRLHQGGELNPTVALMQTRETLEVIALGPKERPWVLMEVDLFIAFDEQWSIAADHVRSLGFDVVLAHPERAINMAEKASLDRVRAEVRNGVRIAVNAPSLLYQGSEHQRIALQLIDEGLVTAAASDVHPSSRETLISSLLDERRSLGLSERDVLSLIGEGPRDLLNDGCV